MVKDVAFESVKIRPDREFSAELVDIHPPSPVVVVSEGWPSVIAPLRSLNVPLEGAFFPEIFHKHFNP